MGTPTSEINWDATHAEFSILLAIADRWLADHEDDRMTLVMDLTATHKNGCPLDLERLLRFPDFDFAHDICGIASHIDRETGKLTRGFLPRCAK